MNRYKTISLFTLVCSCIINNAYANITLPIPVITSDPNAFTLYMGIDEYPIRFDSNSYDPDNGEPYGNNNGIVRCEWYLYDYSTEDYYIISYDESIWFDPDALGLAPGYYAIDLVVTDDDDYGNTVSGWNYYLQYGDWCGTRDIYVADADFSCDDENVEYGTGTTFHYTIWPDSDWDPDWGWLEVYDEEENRVYGNAQLYPEEGVQYNIIWDGKGNTGIYNGVYLPPGIYTVFFYVINNGILVQKTRSIAVYNVTDVQWVTYGGGNIPLDTCPKNGGKRIFPGKKTYNDQSTTRNRAYFEATITPALEGRSVYFTLWDVDDPSADGTPIDTYNIQEGETIYQTGPDNLGTTTSSNVVTKITNSNGIAQGIIAVKMYPGTNYKIVASAAENQVKKESAGGQMSQKKADGIDPLPDGVKSSPMLTVWRHLWIEQDSMGAVASSGDEKNFISGTAYAYHQDSQDDVILGEEIEFDSAFCGGGSGENDDNFEDGFYYVSGYDPYDIVSNHFAHSTLGTPHNPVHNLVVDGHPSTDGGSGQPISLDYDCYDDDYRIDGGNIVPYITLPCNDSLDSYELKFNPAYIKPTHLTEYEDEITFYRNYNSYFVAYGLGSWDEERNIDNEYCTSSFWYAYILSAYQSEVGKDNDPDSETNLTGMTYMFGDNNECAVFMECALEFLGYRNTTAHELVHTGCGTGHCGNEGCISDNSGSVFCDECIAEMRSQVEW